ncbi:hypothetical protein [Acuticoccus sp.]|uniref:hypothetical protein n=1 Tax=Acuticoccus sp. TaxID=1904378 RepID=UPI003B51C24C
MRKLALVAVLATLPFVAQSQPADASPICKDRADMIRILSKKFGETQRSFGLQNDSRVLELYASSDGTWTAILSLPSGKSCVVAAGEAWTVVPQTLAGEPA